MCEAEDVDYFKVFSLLEEMQTCLNKIINLNKYIIDEEDFEFFDAWRRLGW